MELTLFFTTNLLEEPSDFMIFVGRFHPLVVHLPIGFLVMASIAQFATRLPKFYPLKPFLKFLWGLGAISAALAVVFGYLLSLSGDYNEDTLFWHKWSGVAVLAFSIGCYYVSKQGKAKLNVSKWILTILAVGTMIYTGHLGGNLTHGQTYLLEYAPNLMRNVAGLPPKTKPRPKVTVLDSADVYLDLISPMMNSRCISCHNPGKKKGDLLLTTYANMMKGGENGEVIIPGNVAESELFQRITLPENHDDFMPSEGKRPLTAQEVAIIEWWISSGAPSEGFVTELDNEKKITATLNNYLGLDKNNLLNLKVTAADKSILDSLQQQGFVINRLMRDNYYLEANFSLSEKKFTITDLELLLQIKEQLVWLDVSNSGVKDEHLKKIGQLENVVKLDLSGNTISDHELEQLSELKNLESLNLYNTQVSTGLLNLLPKLTKLQKIYLWRTEVNDSLLQKIQRANQNLNIVSSRSAEINNE